MECKKRNRNKRYAIFRDSNLNRLSNVLLNRTRSFFRWMVNYLANYFFPFFDTVFYIFGRFVETKCRIFLRMARQVFDLLTFVRF